MQATVEAELAVINPSVAPVAGRESAMSWGAVVAGAVAAAALSLILIALGTGLGLSSVSPWTNEGASVQAMGYATAAWLLATAALASGLGGYLAGRLRRKWTDVEADEAYFRDTAHGFLAWGVATLVTAAVLTSAAASVAGTAAKTAAAGLTATGATTAAVASGATSQRDSGDYFVDMMFRSGTLNEPEPPLAATKREVAGITTKALATGELSQGDRTYLAQLVANRTDLSAAEAEQRVTQVVEAALLAADAAQAKARQVADVTRAASAKSALWIFAAFLIGAFSASLAATWGGRRRDTPLHFRTT
jgi:hypothetical protein